MCCARIVVVPEGRVAIDVLDRHLQLKRVRLFEHQRDLFRRRALRRLRRHRRILRQRRRLQAILPHTLLLAGDCLRRLVARENVLRVLRLHLHDQARTLFGHLSATLCESLLVRFAELTILAHHRLHVVTYCCSHRRRVVCIAHRPLSLDVLVDARLSSAVIVIPRQLGAIRRITEPLRAMHGLREHRRVIPVVTQPLRRKHGCVNHVTLDLHRGRRDVASKHAALLRWKGFIHIETIKRRTTGGHGRGGRNGALFRRILLAALDCLNARRLRPVVFARSRPALN